MDDASRERQVERLVVIQVGSSNVHMSIDAFCTVDDNE